MARPRRRILLGCFTFFTFVTLAAVLRVGWEWKQALDNVDVMIIPTVALPTVEPTAAPASPDHNAPVATQPTVVPTPEMTPGPNEPINILLLGTDARIGEDIARTDAVIVIHIDPHAERVSMLSLPRDLSVEVPGYGMNKINAAYPIGEARLGPGYGPALAKKTVSDLLGIPIHHFMLINFEGFETLIDKLGGITVDVPQPLVDPKYPVDEFEGDTRTRRIYFPAGEQKLSGEQALIYSRTRYADSDFGRNQRQQQVLMAIFERVRDRGVLSQLTSIDDYTSAMRDYVRMDLSRSDMLSLASLGPRLRAENIQRYALDSKMIVPLKDADTFAADPKKLRRLVGEFVGDSVASADNASTR